MVMNPCLHQLTCVQIVVLEKSCLPLEMPLENKLAWLLALTQLQAMREDIPH